MYIETVERGDHKNYKKGELDRRASQEVRSILKG